MNADMKGEGKGKGLKFVETERDVWEFCIRHLFTF